MSVRSRLLRLPLSVLALSLGGCSTAPLQATLPAAAPPLPQSEAILLRTSLDAPLLGGEPVAPGWVRVAPLPGRTAEESVDLLSERPGVLWAERSVRYRVQGHPVPTAPPLLHRILLATGDPSDPRLPECWGLARTGVPGAWGTTAGDGAIRVGVVDTGVERGHEDLQGDRIEAGPNLVQPGREPEDDVGHGSHVAGTIGATAHNSLGIAGVAWGARVVGVKVLGADGSGSVEDIAAGIRAATAAGVRVLNLSLGGGQSSRLLAEAVAEAIRRDIVVVAAAGNDGDSRLTYPAALPGVLAVGSTDRQDRRSSFSNHGSFVRVAAPGSDILSTAGGGYKAYSGTSMAAPHVAGAAALIRSVRPDLPAPKVIELLLASTSRASGFAGSMPRLDVAQALTLARQAEPGTQPNTPPDPSPAPLPQPTPPSRPSPAPVAPTLPSPRAGDPDGIISAVQMGSAADGRLRLDWRTREQARCALSLRNGEGSAWRLHARSGDGVHHEIILPLSFGVAGPEGRVVALLADGRRLVGARFRVGLPRVQ
ncbi:MAG: S8 family serine peptidase [Candidatus Sericytochromatia bacterium]|nr:S8 family serine peptidase [Candidatus Sericytochromatia bacterium]